MTLSIPVTSPEKHRVKNINTIMGDRGNIVIRQAANTNRDDVWFYGHWSGSTLKQTVQSALAKKWRWGDESYLARIVFDELTKGNTGKETGFGISTHIQDNSHPNPIVIIDCPSQGVFEIAENDIKGGRLPDSLESAKNLGTFAEFILIKF
jgi:hypothetical protein